jgi:hypothetical protein
MPTFQFLQIKTSLPLTYFDILAENSIHCKHEDLFLDYQFYPFIYVSVLMALLFIYVGVCCCFVFVCETGSSYVAKNGFKFTILLPLSVGIISLCHHIWLGFFAYFSMRCLI